VTSRFILRAAIAAIELKAEGDKKKRADCKIYNRPLALRRPINE